ncbi:MAG: homocysteine S-methyltransferase [Myxococcaceae bacterium]|nr:homocysteine S-methyltransferase [Myxococcaceae bacterium]
MNNPFQRLFAQRGLVFFDPALATELERRGAELSSHLWSASLITDDPEAIIAVHLDALRAGADVISSASYQASRPGFAKLGLSDAEADARLTRAVTLAREAVERHGSPGRLVAASLGPYGAVLADGSEFTGDYPLSPRALADFHAPRVEAALKGAPDLVLFETLPSMAEAEAVARVAQQFADVAFMASFSAKGDRLCHGERFADVVATLESVPNVIAAGLNCTAPDVIAPLLRTVPPTRLALAASPNAGQTWDAPSRSWKGTPYRGEDFATLAQAFVDAGATIIGGCCRTRPDDLAAAVKTVRPSPSPRGTS